MKSADRRSRQRLACSVPELRLEVDVEAVVRAADVGVGRRRVHAVERHDAHGVAARREAMDLVLAGSVPKGQLTRDGCDRVRRVARKGQVERLDVRAEHRRAREAVRNAARDRAEVGEEARLGIDVELPVCHPARERWEMLFWMKGIIVQPRRCVVQPYAWPNS